MTYLPGQAVVPCAVCGTMIYRRGSNGAGHRKWCSPECKKAGKRLAERARTGAKPRRSDGICPRCNTNPRRAREDGGLRGWCGPCEAAQKEIYNRSPAGRATVRRYAEHHGLIRSQPTGICAWCGVEFSRRTSRGASHQRFCTPACRAQNKKYRWLFERKETT